MKRQRTITIGAMLPGWYVRYLQWGVPDGFYVHWRGRNHPFDPCEFFSWRDVVRAIDVRLGMARLKRVGEVVKRVKEFWTVLQVVVERAYPARASYPDGAMKGKEV